jgi:hypothetical protein
MRVEFEMNPAVGAPELTKNLRHSPARGRRRLGDRKSAVLRKLFEFPAISRAGRQIGRLVIAWSRITLAPFR